MVARELGMTYICTAETRKKRHVSLRLQRTRISHSRTKRVYVLAAVFVVAG